MEARSDNRISTHIDAQSNMEVPLTTDTQVPEGIYDPDNAPERPFLGKFTKTAYVDGQKVTPSYGTDEDTRIINQCTKYAGKSSDYQYEMWFLEAEGVDVVRDDGQPFRKHDIIKLRSKNGVNLSKKQAPDQIAQLFKNLGVTASYAHAGDDNSALGRTFEFVSRDLALGGGMKKGINLFPLSIMDADWVYSGEPRVVHAKVAEDDGAPIDGGASTLTEEEVLTILKEVLDGKRPEDMMQAIMDTKELRGIPSVLGVPLIDSAIDESLATTLSQHRVMGLAPDGTLQVI